MIQPGLDKLSLQELQQAVMGMNPAIKPFEALGALQKRVKDQEMKNSQAMQMPDQPPVAQAAMQQAQQLEQQVQNPYMASGLGAAPVASPVQSGQGVAAMASGGSTADGSMVSAPAVYEDDSTLADLAALEKSYDTPQHSSPMFAGGGEVKHFGGGGQGLTPAEQLQQEHASFLTGLQNFGAAAKDIATLPGRAIAGIANTGIRGVRAITGADIPYMFGNDPNYTNSMTPFTDTLNTQREAANTNPNDLRLAQGAVGTPANGIQPNATGTPTPTTQQGTPAVNTAANPFAQPAPQATTQTSGPGLAGAKSGMGLNLNTAGVGLGAVKPLTETVDSPEQMLATRNKFLGTAEDRKAAHAEELKPFQDIADDYKKNIDSEKNNRTAEALIAAGLGIAGGTSPNALTNIANGAKEGLAAIQASKKAEQEARDKMASANLQMAAAKISLNKGDKEEADKFMTNYYTDKRQADMYNLTAQHYANSDAAEAIKAKASMLSAQNSGVLNQNMINWHDTQVKEQALKATADSLTKQITEYMKVPSASNKALAAPLQQQLQTIQGELAKLGGIQSPYALSPQAGNKVLDFNSIK